MIHIVPPSSRFSSGFGQILGLKDWGHTFTVENVRDRQDRQDKNGPHTLPPQGSTARRPASPLTRYPLLAERRARLSVRTRARRAPHERHLLKRYLAAYGFGITNLRSGRELLRVMHEERARAGARSPV